MIDLMSLESVAGSVTPQLSTDDRALATTAPDMLLSKLLHQSSIALGADTPDGANTAQTLDSLLRTIQPPESMIEAARDMFHSASIETIFEVGDEILTAAKEHHLRGDDAEPRTTDVHVRELLGEGDDPSSILQVMDRWNNPARIPQVTEDLRLTVAEEWARKMALEQQPLDTIQASLMLNVPDATESGHNHSAVASRMFNQVRGTDAPTPPEVGQSQSQSQTLNQGQLFVVDNLHPELNVPMPRR
jgi:hypothetical protein